MTEHTKGKSTNLSAFNGEIHVGDYVLYEDGWLTFKVQIVEQDGAMMLIPFKTYDLNGPKMQSK